MDQLNLEGKEIILGLYSGSGPIEIFLSKKARQVIGIDSDPANVSAASRELQAQQYYKLHFLPIQGRGHIKAYSNFRSLMYSSSIPREPV